MRTFEGCLDGIAQPYHLQQDGMLLYAVDEFLRVESDVTIGVIRIVCLYR